MARRPARLVAALGVLLVLGFGAGACSSINELIEVETRIEREGYQVTDRFHDDLGGSSRNEVQIEAETNRGLPPPDGQEEIAGIIWETYPRRFDTVAVTLDDDLVVFDRGQLQERFGPRAERLDEQEFSEDLSSTIRSAAIFGLIGLVVLVVGVVALVITLRRRRARRGPSRPPAGFGGPPGYGPGPGPVPPPPPSGPPPGWTPPPGSGSGYPPPKS